MKNETLTAILNEKDKLSAYMGVGVDYYKGETGKSGADEVYIGAEPPTDPQVKLWVDTEAQSVGAVDWDDVGNKPNFATVATSGSYNDLTDKPVIPEAPDLTPYAKTADLSTVATSGSYEDLTNKPNLFSGNYEDLTNKPNLFDGDYNNLTNKPTIPEPYTLPIASTDTLGGVKVDGSTITIADGVISYAGGGGTDLSNGFVTDTTNNTSGLYKAIIMGQNNNYTGDTHGGSIWHSIILGSDNNPTYYGTTLVNTISCGTNIGLFPSKNIYNSLFVGEHIGPIGMSGAGAIYDTILGGGESKCSANCICGFGFGHGVYVNTYQFVIGDYNILDESQTYNFIIGKGSENWDRANSLTVDKTGNLAIAGTMSSAGADYAEFFEWKDGNPEAEDRVGYIVALDGDKLILANEGDYILGVVSGTATVLGDNPEWNWAKRWITDDFGRIQYEDKVIHHEAKGDIPAWDETIKAPIVNPDYDPDQKYIKRADRPEWSAVGMMGKLYVRDDGTCQVNGYAKPINGVATASTSGTMRVIERVSDNVIRVVIK